jgi:hypothetical protein
MMPSRPDIERLQNVFSDPFRARKQQQNEQQHDEQSKYVPSGYVTLIQQMIGKDRHNRPWQSDMDKIQTIRGMAVRNYFCCLFISSFICSHQ